MPKSVWLAALALALIVIGVLLPWTLQGDFIPIWTPGLAIIPAFKDNGGLLIILLAIASFASVVRSSQAIRPFGLLPAGLAGLVLVLALAHVTRVVRVSALQGTVIGAVTLHLGLPLVIAGATLLLITATKNSARTTA